MSGGLEWWSTRPKIHWFAEGIGKLPRFPSSARLGELADSMAMSVCSVEYEQCGFIRCTSG
jgi:hypothetical protein